MYKFYSSINDLKKNVFLSVCHCCYDKIEGCLPEISMAELRKKIGDGLFALELDGSVSDLDPDKLPGLESPERSLIPFLAKVGVKGLKV